MHWYKQCPLMGTELSPWDFTLCTGIIVTLNGYPGFELFLSFVLQGKTYFRNKWKYLTDGRVTINRKWVFLFLTPMGIYFWSNTRKMDARSITTLRSIVHMCHLTHYLWITGLEESSVEKRWNFEWELVEDYKIQCLSFGYWWQSAEYVSMFLW